MRLRALSTGVGRMSRGTTSTFSVPEFAWSIGVRPDLTVTNANREMADAHTTHDWRRFWVPRPALATLDDSGFLVDPEGDWGSALSPGAVTLASLDVYRILILLGEPGMGKSTELAADTERLRTLGGATDAVLRIDLRDYENVADLRDSVLGGPQVAAWRHGSGRLTLTFDSLDEGLLATAQLADGLARYLATLALDPSLNGRLRVRIACRTAVWPDSAESKFRAAWGDEHVLTCVLAPLRRVDVTAALRNAGVADPAAVLTELLHRGAGALAARPVTLNFLATAVRDGAVPDSQVALYREGCLRLAREPNVGRAQRGTVGKCSARERLAIAARAAAVTVFGNRAALCIGPVAGLATHGPDLDVAELDGGEEPVRQADESKVGETRVVVTQEAVRETLDTALFHGAALEGATSGALPSGQIARLTWAHWSFAEYLAARWVQVNGLTVAQQDQLFLTHATGAPRVVPQLRQTAAWFAGHDPEFLRRIVRWDPEVVLGSDLGVADDADRARIVDTILTLARIEELHDLYQLSNKLRALAHPGLTGQLLPVIADSTEPVAIRKLALRIGAEAGTTEFAAAAVDLALDQAAPSTVRKDAIRAVRLAGTPVERARLRPLLLLGGALKAPMADAGQPSGDPDPDDELRGAALQALWPAHLTAEELFSSLTPRKRSSLIGSYSMFLQQLVDQLEKGGLDDKALEVALRWCEAESDGASRRRSARASFHGGVPSAVVRAAWRRLRVSELSSGRSASARGTLVERLAAVSVRNLMEHEPLVDEKGAEDLGAALAHNGRRQEFVRALVTKLARAIRTKTGEGVLKDADYLGMTLVRRSSVRGEDALWLISDLRKATAQEDDDTAAVYIAVLMALVSGTGDTAFDVVYIAAYGHASASLSGESPSSDSESAGSTVEARQNGSIPDCSFTFGNATGESEITPPGAMLSTWPILPALARALAPFVKAVPLDSIEAQRAREAQAEMEKFEAKSREFDKQVEKDIAFVGRSAQESARKVIAGDVGEWWRLNLWLCYSERGHLEELDSRLAGRYFWNRFDDATQAALIRAAATYVEATDDNRAAWPESDRLERPAMAGFRALRLLQELAPDIFAGLPKTVWHHWARVIVAFPLYNDAHHDWYGALLTRAYDAAPDLVAAVVVELVAAEDAKHGRPFVLDKIAVLWSTSDGGAALGAALLSHLCRGLASGGVAPTCSGLEAMLSTLLMHNAPSARELAESLLRDAKCDFISRPISAPSVTPATAPAADCAETDLPPLLSSGGVPSHAVLEDASGPEPTDEKEAESTPRPARTPRERALSAAEALVRCSVDAGWNLVWPLVNGDREFASVLIINLAGHHLWPKGSLASRLDEAAVAKLHILMVELYPALERDEDHEGGRWVTPRDEVVQWCDGLLQHLAGLGTLAALEAIREVRARFPHRTGLVHIERAAETALRRTTWAPATPADLIALARDGRYRIVRTERDLADAIVASLTHFGAEVRGPNAAVEQLWDEGRDDFGGKTGCWYPKDEEALSNAITAHLTRDIGPGGFTSVREVRLRPALGVKPAEDIDIYVVATVEEANGRRRTVTVLLEVKGQWFKQLADALRTQLVERYLAHNPETSTGVFVVGWYLCPEWDPNHYQRRDAEKNGSDLESFAKELDTIAGALSTHGRDVRAVVLDLSLSATPAGGGLRTKTKTRQQKQVAPSVVGVAQVKTATSVDAPVSAEQGDGAPMNPPNH